MDLPFTLDRFQLEAIAHLDAGRSVLVAAPTGTGKTVIADHMVDRALARGAQVIYTAPIKALSNQKFRDYCRLHGAARVGLVTGDLVIRQEAPCLVMTTEILRNMLLAGQAPPRLRHVILDEIHFLDDRERGTTWEEVLIYLDPGIQVLGLSATLSNLDEFARWLGSVRGETAVVREDTRAVPLSFNLFNRKDGLVDEDAFERAHKGWERWKAEVNRETRIRHPRGRRGPPTTRRAVPLEHLTRHTDAVETCRKAGLLPCLYFVFSRKNAEQYALQLVNRRPRLLDHASWRLCQQVLDQWQDEVGTEVLTPGLRRMYEQGVAFHHAGLHVQVKGIVEQLYEQRLIQVLYCTSTFALGINMPARTVVFDALKKFDGREVVPLTVRQFMQKAGRAGRRGMDEVGHVVVRMDHEEWTEVRPHVQRYRTGSPEPVRSSFNLSFNSVANLLHRLPMDRIRPLLARSYLSFQLEERAREEARAVERLERGIRKVVGEARLPPDAPLPQPSELPPPVRARARELQRLQRRRGDLGDRVWADFQRRVGFLQAIGYLAEDRSFNAGAHVVRQVQISEVFVAELFLSGVLETPDPPLLFGLACGMVQTLGRGVASRMGLGHAAREVASQATGIRFNRAVAGADRITGLETTWCPDLIPFGQAWARGVDLAEILEQVESPTDLSGDLVGAFRRARDLVGQLVPLWSHDPARQDQLRDLLRVTGRGEVEVVD